jgi:hypothetical protein
MFKLTCFLYFESMFQTIVAQNRFDLYYEIENQLLRISNFLLKDYYRLTIELNSIRE